MKKVVSEKNIERLDKFKRWMKINTNLSAITQKNYLKHMELFFKDFNVFSKEDFMEWIVDLDKYGLAVQTLNFKINSFNKFCEFMNKPNLKCKLAKVERRLFLENIPTEEQYLRLINYLRLYENKDYYYWVRILACTGARVSEFLLITWEDITKGNFLLKGKGNKYRNFFIPKELSQEIAEYASKNYKCGNFVKNRSGKPMTARGLSQRLQDFGKKTKLPKEIMHPHAWRHFFAKQYLKSSKGDVMQLSEYLGHESLDTTRLYLLKSKEEQRKDYNKHVNW